MHPCVHVRLHEICRPRLWRRHLRQDKLRPRLGGRRHGFAVQGAAVQHAVQRAAQCVSMLCAIRRAIRCCAIRCCGMRHLDVMRQPKRFHTPGLKPRFHAGFMPISYRTQRRPGFIPISNPATYYIYIYVLTSLPVSPSLSLSLPLYPSLSLSLSLYLSLSIIYIYILYS